MLKYLWMVVSICFCVCTNVWAVYPDRPIVLVVPFPAGGPADALGRALAHAMSVRLGQPVLVENRAGAGGLVGITSVANAQPDGYLLGMAGTGAMIYAPFISKKMPFDPLTGLTHITTVVRTPNVLIVNANSSIKTLSDLIAKAKAAPNRITYASAGVASSAHVVGELLQLQAGIKLTHVPYKGGAPAIQDLMGGHVDVMVAEVSGVRAAIAAGTLRALALSDSTRLITLKDVPSAPEVGLPGWLANGAYGLVAPPGLAAEITKRLNETANEALASPEVIAKFNDMASLTQPGQPANYRALIKSEQERWGPVIRAAGITAD
jgi:tripartite-type tricarboxylate transporter receptor subunit TctC